ncbi:MAG: hypothetical protein KGP14_12380 [Betaproteobacteria bacterium]|nr:hypothetical protein [Betaproteobacteria bacterium]
MRTVQETGRELRLQPELLPGALPAEGTAADGSAGLAHSLDHAARPSGSEGNGGGSHRRMAGARNHLGWRVGEWHGKAKLSDFDVRNMRLHHETLGWGYHRCATHWGCGISTARDICTYRTRASA